MGSSKVSFNEDAAMRSQEAAAKAQAKYGTYGVNSLLGNLRVVQNADGTSSLTYDPTKADTQRQSLISEGLGKLSLDPTQAQNAYYQQATRQLLPQFQQDQDRLHEQLINRGITEGSALYNDQMEKLRNQQSGQLSDISNQAVYQGQNYLASQIGNIGNLANQYDALKVGSLGGSTGANFQDTYGQKYQSNLANAQAKNQMWGTVGSLAGMALGAFL